MEQRDRKTYLDGIRIFASFAVIYNHVFGYRFFDVPGLGGIAAQFAFFLSKVAVPLFFMISGLLLLPREDSYRKTFSRILRIGAVLAAMCVFYYIADWIANGGAFEWRTLLLSVYSEPVNTNAFWFLYAYLSMLIMLPILQRMVASFDRGALTYYLTLTLLIGGLIPLILWIWPQCAYSPWLHLPIYSSYIGMMLMGLYIDRYLERSVRGQVLAACGALAFTAASVVLTRIDDDPYLYGNLFYDNRALLPSMAAAGCLFYLCKCGFMTPRTERGQRRLRAVSRLTFCTYLFGDFFINLLKPMRASAVNSAAPYLGLLSVTLLAYALSMLLAAVLTRIPGVRKLL